MVYSPIISRIVARASTLEERIEASTAAFTPSAEPAESETDPIVAQRLADWQTSLGSYRDRLSTRIAWSGWTEAAVRRGLGAVAALPPAADAPLPTWAETLRLVLELNGTLSQPLAAYRHHNPAQPVPFEDVLLPWLELGRRRLTEQAGPHLTLLAESAAISLERYLLGLLVHLHTQPLNLAFQQHKARRDVRQLFGFQPSAGSTQHYADFIEDLRATKLADFYLEYSMLARLSALTLEFWVAEGVEFLERLAQDWPRLQPVFGLAELAHSRVVNLRNGLSDLHHGGRSVKIIEFEGGGKLVYKPRNLGLEGAFGEFVEWLNTQNTPLDLKTPRLVDAGSHGWVEFIETRKCPDPASLGRYYRRLGMTLAVVHTLAGTDCHYENLLACGEYPVLIDAETLLSPNAHPEQLPENEAAAEYAAQQTYWEKSVLRTAMVPYVDALTGQRHDFSPLINISNQTLVYQVPRWLDINTDAMRLVFEPGQAPAWEGQPGLEGADFQFEDYFEDFVVGFEEMYTFLLEQHDYLTGPNSPLAILAGQPTRFLFRNTKVYGLTLNSLLSLKTLREGVDYSLKLETLTRAFLAFDDRPILWPLLQVEKQALGQGDVPLLLASTSSCALPRPGGAPIENLFECSGSDLALSRLRGLSKADLAWQVEIIRSTVGAYLRDGLSKVAAALP